jgi:hypothetical protein
MPSKEPLLTAEDIRAAVWKRLERYKNLNLLEHFAMFMGIAQVLEFTLKGLLHRRFQIDLDAMERWTLGKVATALKGHGLRSDFTALLDSVVGYRNHIAHSLLANEAMLRALLEGNPTRFEVRELEKGTYELEQLCFLYDWTEEHNAWDERPA